MQTIINKNKHIFAENHASLELEKDIQDIKKSSINNIDEFLAVVNKYKSDSKRLGIFQFDNLFWITVKYMIVDYTNAISNIDTNIYRGRNYMDFNEFENLHTELVSACMTFSVLNETLLKFQSYPQDFMIAHEKIIVNKLLDIYQQLLSFDVVEQHYLNPLNVRYYFNAINKYSKENLSSFSVNFVKNYANPKCKFVLTNMSEISELICYLIDNLSDIELDQIDLEVVIFRILVNRIKQIQNKYADKQFQYLIELKKIIKKMEHIPKYTLIDTLNEIIKKNINGFISTSGISNLYKQETDYSKIDVIIADYQKNKRDSDSQIDTCAEEKMIKNMRKLTHV